jgi:DNA-binding NarL/FixJ family response regulator
VRVAIADDHALVRAGLRALLETLAGVEVIGEAADGRDALALIEKTAPDVVLMDVSMPGMNGIEALRRAMVRQCRARIVMLSIHADEKYVREALVAGAAGYLLKTAERSELEMALQAVARGDPWLSPAVSKTLVRALSQREVARPVLTPRQREVLQLIAEGNSTRQIARLLGISVKTAETHRAQMMERLDIHDLAGLVRYALRTGIVRQD